MGVPDFDLVHYPKEEPWAAGGAFDPSKVRPVLLIEDLDDLDDHRTYVYVCPRTTQDWGRGIEHHPHEHRPGGIDVVGTCLIDLPGQVSGGWPAEKARLLASAEWSCREPPKTGLLCDLDAKRWAL